jgi:hypothetical protein
MRRPLPTPSLDAWRRELAAGQRTLVTLDAVWRAACGEQHALEADVDGLLAVAGKFRRKAHELRTRMV